MTAALLLLVSQQIFAASAVQDTVPPTPLLAAQEEEPKEGEDGQEPEEEKPEKEKPFLEGLLGIPATAVLSAKYRGRWTGEDNDQDLYEYLTLDVGDPEQYPLTAHLFLRATEDVGGDEEEREFSTFNDSTNTFDSSANGRLYHLYIDLHDTGPIKLGRLGRQFLIDTPEVLYMDGLRLDSTKAESMANLEVGAYAGVPVNLYESSPNGDFMAGAFAQISPFNGTRIRADYTRIEDEFAGAERSNDLIGVSLWQSLGSYLQFRYRISVLDSEARDHEARIFGYLPEPDLRIRLSYYQLLNEEEETLAVDFDSYILAARSYFPFWELRLVAAKGFGDNFVVELGAQLRNLEDEDDEGRYNHEYRRVYLTPTVLDWPEKNLEWSLTVEVWDTPGTDDGDVQTAGLDVSYRFSEPLKASAGTYYSLYKYDLYDDEERQNVRTVFVRGSYDLDKTTRITARYEYENGDYDKKSLNNVHVLWIGVRKTF